MKMALRAAADKGHLSLLKVFEQEKERSFVLPVCG
jgi:hypothetical protein